jgi:hypothetical protein
MLQIDRFFCLKDQLLKTGKYILAQADTETVIVYQAYQSSIGLYAGKMVVSITVLVFPG